MAFIPKVELTLTPNGDIVMLTDTTRMYSIFNVTGWGAGVTTEDIITSNVKVYDLANTLIDTYILKDNIVNYYDGIPTSTPDSFSILETDWTSPDGIYKTVYTIYDGTLTYMSNNNVLFLYNLCNCKNTIVADISVECNSAKKDLLKKSLDQIEMFIYGIQSAFSVGEFGKATNILETASIYCKTVSDCGCGC